ncbi:hypothetical protein FACS189491_07100 [Spirochaetia bacterium]|nr:hypothetical protein FACS189491_07100 [Spirochaetia bacterium]
MKRYYFMVLVFFAGMALFAQSDELKLWIKQYNDSVSITDKFGVLQEAKASSMAEPGDFFSWALDQLLLDYPNLRAGNLVAAENSVRFIAGILGNAKYTAAGPGLWRTVETFSNSLVKADALIALGKGGMTDYLPNVTQLLTKLNAVIPLDRNLQIENGRIAYGAILSLENYKDISGYLPVFFASNGWYDKQIKDQASASLPIIASDPTESMLTVIKSLTYTYDMKYLALQAEDASQASAESKSSVAIAALEEAWRFIGSDVRRRSELAAIRKLSLKMIRRYSAPDEPAVYVLMDRSYNEAIDLQERLDTIDVLSALATDSAAESLASKIEILRDKLLDSGRPNGGITNDEEKLIRALIPALKATKNMNSRTRKALQDIADNSYATNAVRQLARKALQDIG